jgi:hypothetical protein
MAAVLLAPAASIGSAWTRANKRLIFRDGAD